MEDFTHKEFKIDTLPDETFRIGIISPVDLLAISTQMNFENLEMTTSLIKFSLENIEVKLGDKWLPVKVKDREVYQPLGINTNMFALNELFMYMVEEVIVKAFTKSSE